MRKKMIKDKDIGIYLNLDWQRSFKSKWMQGSIELVMYKGRVLMSVDATTERAAALARHANVREAADAWMNVNDIDTVIKLLREARRTLRMHQTDVRKVAHCENCSRIFGGVCDKHRYLFKKYKRRKRAEAA